LAPNRSRLKDNVSYLEILISSFLKHEENLNNLIVKLGEIVEKLSEFVEEIRKDEDAPKGSRKNLVFIKIENNIPLKERRKIQEILNR